MGVGQDSSENAPSSGTVPRGAAGESLVLLTDYKGQFGSKYAAVPYRSGMDIGRLVGHLRATGFAPEILGFPDVDFRSRNWSRVPVLYTSSEDAGGHYKSYIEDVVLGLELAGARIVPAYRYLRAHHDKVFMEVLRDLIGGPVAAGLASSHFGTREEWEARRARFGRDAVVLKPAAGALGRGVARADGERELRARVTSLSRTRHLREELHDWVRALRRPGYVRESRHRGKFVVQPLVEGLDHDWKLLVFGPRVYALRRENRPGDFRASGSGRLSAERDLPPGLLDYAAAVRERLELPCVSLDVGVHRDGFVLLEFQALYFGTYTVDRSDFHFLRRGEGWEVIEGPSELEQVYAECVAAGLTR